MRELTPMEQYSDGFHAGLDAGLGQAAHWLEVEAARWPQDTLRRRIEGIASDIRKLIHGECLTPPKLDTEPK